MVMILVISPKNTYAAERLKHEAGKMNQELLVLSAEELAKVDFKIDVNQYSVLYVRNPYVKSRADYIKSIINLAQKFDLKGKRVIDANIVKGNLGLGKWHDYQILKAAGISTPKTTLFKEDPVPGVYPLILKWIYGQKARGTYLINSHDDLKNVLSLHPECEWVWQEYIEADYEYKIVTVGYKSLPVMLRFKLSGSKFKIDYASGEPVFSAQYLDVASLAERASKTLGRELSKVDILDKGGKLYVLEANRFPGLKNFEKLSKYNAFKHFVEYLRE
jgi:glutathione synthase/RimK-type ligase-like ATP-grasp enzyme